MAEVVICEPLRTPVGRFGGVLRDVPARVLIADLIRQLVARSGLRGDDIDDVILGQGSPSGEAPSIGRVAALDAGLGITVPGQQVDRRCGAGLQAVLNGAMQVATGAADLVLAGGVESMSQTEFAATGLRWGVTSETVPLVDRLARARVTAGGSHHPVPGGMVETAENLRAAHRISRSDQDALALQSHQRAVAAQLSGTFAEEIVPIAVPQRRGESVLVTADEHPRADTSLESLAKLRPLRLPEDADSTVTAGNASGQNDGAAVCVVTTPARARTLGLRPLARVVSWAVAGVAPETMGIGPVPATEKALKRAGLTLDQMDLIELNEAFAVQVLAVTRTWVSSPTTSVSIHTAPASRWAIRSGRLERASSPRCCASWTAGRPVTGWKPCVSAAVRVWRPCSSG
jgi:acetyl-CoA C-acetyltransferase